MFNFFKKKEEGQDQASNAGNAPQVNVLNNQGGQQAVTTPAPQTSMEASQPAMGGEQTAPQSTTMAGQDAATGVPSTMPTPAPAESVNVPATPSPAQSPMPSPVAPSAAQTPIAEENGTMAVTPDAPETNHSGAPAAANITDTPAAGSMTQSPATPTAPEEPVVQTAGDSIEITPGAAEDADAQPTSPAAMPVATAPASTGAVQGTTSPVAMTPPSEENSLDDENTPGPIEETIVSTSKTENGEMSVKNDNPNIGDVGANDDPTADTQAQPVPAPSTPAPVAQDDASAQPVPVAGGTTAPAPVTDASEPISTTPEPSPAPADTASTDTTQVTETTESSAVPTAPEGADENAKLDSDGTLPQDMSNPAPAPVDQPAGQESTGVDKDQLKQLTNDQVAQRPDEPTAVTGDSQGNPAQKPAADESDPLAKLFSMVKDSGVDVTKPEFAEKVFVLSGKSKVSNSFLKQIVERSLKAGATPDAMITFILNVDKLAEEGELKDDFFEYIAKNGMPE